MGDQAGSIVTPAAETTVEEEDAHDNDDDDDVDAEKERQRAAIRDVLSKPPSPVCDLPNTWAGGQRRIGVVYMDAFSPYHGMYVSQMAVQAWGVGIVYVLSDYMEAIFTNKKQDDPDQLERRIPDSDSQAFDEWLSKLPFEPVALICESDSGLSAGEHLGRRLGLKKHDGVNPARRDKYLMNEAVGQAGLPVVQQKLCSTLEEAKAFAKGLGLSEEESSPVSTVLSNNDVGTINPLDVSVDFMSNTGSLGSGSNTRTTQSGMQNTAKLVIVKPVRGVASSSVYLCKDRLELEEAFEKIHQSSVFGSINQQHEAVLIQEFAVGTEYAVDTVSRDGEMKIAAIWRYDKRPANGAPFVYHATELVDADTATGRAVYDYIDRTLQVLGVRWGLTHTEVIVDEDHGPRLVEVNCRHHNADFAPLAMFCIGYNALDMLLCAYLQDEPGVKFPSETADRRLDWEDLPHLPVTRASGAIVHLVNHVEGTLVGVNGDALQEISDMESVFAMEVYPSFLEIGVHLKKTVDIMTDAGWVQLLNDDKEAFQRDYQRIVDLMPTLFEVE